MNTQKGVPFYMATYKQIKTKFQIKKPVPTNTNFMCKIKLRLKFI